MEEELDTVTLIKVIQLMGGSTDGVQDWVTGSRESIPLWFGHLTGHDRRQNGRCNLNTSQSGLPIQDF